MTSPLNLSPTEFTPAVRYEPSSCELIFEGESYPENVAAFFGPILEWVRGAMNEKAELKVIFALDYLNTSSTKALLDLLSELDSYHLKGGPVTVTWRYRAGVEIMQEAGAELGEDLQLPYRLEAIE